MCHKSVSAEAELRKAWDPIKEENERKPVQQQRQLCVKISLVVISPPRIAIMRNPLPVFSVE